MDELLSKLASHRRHLLPPALPGLHTAQNGMGPWQQEYEAMTSKVAKRCIEQSPRVTVRNWQPVVSEPTPYQLWLQQQIDVGISQLRQLIAQPIKSGNPPVSDAAAQEGRLQSTGGRHLAARAVDSARTLDALLPHPYSINLTSQASAPLPTRPSISAPEVLTTCARMPSGLGRSPSPTQQPLASEPGQSCPTPHGALCAPTSAAPSSLTRPTQSSDPQAALNREVVAGAGKNTRQDIQPHAAVPRQLQTPVTESAPAGRLSNLQPSKQQAVCPPPQTFASVAAANAVSSSQGVASAVDVCPVTAGIQQSQPPANHLASTAVDQQLQQIATQAVVHNAVSVAARVAATTSTVALTSAPSTQGAARSPVAVGSPGIQPALANHHGHKSPAAAVYDTQTASRKTMRPPGQAVTAAKPHPRQLATQQLSEAALPALHTAVAQHCKPSRDTHPRLVKLPFPRGPPLIPARHDDDAPVSQVLNVIAASAGKAADARVGQPRPVQDTMLTDNQHKQLRPASSAVPCHGNADAPRLLPVSRSELQACEAALTSHGVVPGLQSLQTTHCLQRISGEQYLTIVQSDKSRQDDGTEAELQQHAGPALTAQPQAVAATASIAALAAEPAGPFPSQLATSVTQHGPDTQMDIDSLLQQLDQPVEDAGLDDLWDADLLADTFSDLAAARLETVAEPVQLETPASVHSGMDLDEVEEF